MVEDTERECPDPGMMLQLHQEKVLLETALQAINVEINTAMENKNKLSTRIALLKKGEGFTSPAYQEAMNKVDEAAARKVIADNRLADAKTALNDAYDAWMEVGLSQVKEGERAKKKEEMAKKWEVELQRRKDESAKRKECAKDQET